MAKKYYSSRTNKNKLNPYDLYYKIQNTYLYFRDKNYFKELAGITKDTIPDQIKYEAALKLPFQPFPITKWNDDEIIESNLFDTIEFLFDHISKPFGWINYTEDGWNYMDYEGYDRVKGKSEYIEFINMFLNDYDSGYEISGNGEILSVGSDELKTLYKAEIISFDKENVDKKIEHAILKWRSRNQTLDDRKAVIKELADVFEWLKKTKELKEVMNNKDDKIIFEIVNNFSIRHHNPDQKSNYDKTIWYSWMFHFYLATYHALIRLIIKNKNEKKHP